jgi:hypothetical protein
MAASRLALHRPARLCGKDPLATLQACPSSAWQRGSTVLHDDALLGRCWGAVGAAERGVTSVDGVRRVESERHRIVV